MIEQKRLYAKTDQELVATGVTWAKESPIVVSENPNPLFHEISERASERAEYVKGKASKILGGIQSQFAQEFKNLSVSQEQEALDYVGQQVVDRQKARAGLVANLAGRGIVSSEHIDAATGRFDVEKLSNLAFFQDPKNKDRLTALANHTLSNRSKLLKEARSQQGEIVKDSMLEENDVPLSQRTDGNARAKVIKFPSVKMSEQTKTGLKISGTAAAAVVAASLFLGNVHVENAQAAPNQGKNATPVVQVDNSTHQNTPASKSQQTPYTKDGQKQNNGTDHAGGKIVDTPAPGQIGKGDINGNVPGGPANGDEHANGQACDPGRNGEVDCNKTPAPTNTVKPVHTPHPSHTPEATHTPCASPTSVDHTPTSTVVPSATATTVKDTPTATATTAENTQTATATATQPSKTPHPSHTPEATHTPYASPTSVDHTPTVTQVPSATATRVEATPTATATATQPSGGENPTNTPTNTPSSGGVPTSNENPTKTATVVATPEATPTSSPVAAYPTPEITEKNLPKTGGPSLGFLGEIGGVITGIGLGLRRLTRKSDVNLPIENLNAEEVKEKQMGEAVLWEK